MAVAEQGRNRFNLKDLITNSFVGGVLAVGGVGATVGGGYDFIANEIPADNRYFDKLDQQYPLVDSKTLQASEGRVYAYETKIHELIATGQASQIPNLTETNDIMKDYEVIDQNNANQVARTEQQGPNTIRSEVTDSIAVLLGGAASVLGVIISFEARTRKNKNKTEA